MAEEYHAVETSFLDLLEHAYASPPRHYHDFGHARTVATAVEMLGGNRACILAAWCHDVVYDAHRTDNEQASAAWLTAARPDDTDVAEAGRLIEVTAMHNPEPGDRQAQILCDADLAILGAPPTVYGNYVSAVRREYAHVPPPEWRTGRTAVLREFLERPLIYRTERGRERWESAARANINAELHTLHPSEGRPPTT